MGGKSTSLTRMLEALRAFREEHGHCNVPTNCPDNPALGRWVASRRYHKRLGELSAEELRALDAEGFVWRPADEAWDRIFDELQRFHEAHGHCDVPEHWAENQSLANWVQSQRHRRRRDRLPPERVERLDAIGFSWAIYKQTETLSQARATRVQRNPPGERLYALGNGDYAQYGGNGAMPEALRLFTTAHRGEFPAYIPLPKGKTTFLLGVRYVREQRVPWPGVGPLPEPVLQYVKKRRILPPHT